MNDSLNPLQPFLSRFGYLVLDGGLATELERRGHDLGDALWSARLLVDNPQAIRQLHADYLAAGADCIITATYQATIEGFMLRGYSQGKAEGLLRLSVRLAREARDAFWSDERNRGTRLKPLVAASVGPYGAARADGSEYTGDYDLDQADLYDFHARRWQILAGSQADLLACETIPSFPEALALRRLLVETSGRHAWFSFSCRDGRHISDGTPLATCIEALDDEPRVAAVGVNCTPPRFIPQLIEEARRVTSKPLLVYPNSGEGYDVRLKRWHGQADAPDFAAASKTWRGAGASLIGGCCRTGPDHIREIRRLLAA